MGVPGTIVLGSRGSDLALASELASVAARLDQFRRDQIVLLALQGSIRSGEAGKSGDLIGLLETLGGSVEANAATLEEAYAVELARHAEQAA